MRSLLKRLTFMPDGREKVDFSEPLYLLNMLSLNPLIRGRKKIIKFICVISAYLPYILLTLTEIVENPTTGTIHNRIDSLSPQIQVVGHLILLFYYRDQVETLLIKTKNFTPLSEVNAEDLKYVYQPHQIIRIAYRTYQYMMLLNTLIYIIVPVIVSGQPGITMYGTQRPEGPPFYYLQLFFIFTFCVFLASIIVGTDGLFLYFNAHVISELRTVRKEFENLSNLRENQEETYRRLFVKAIKKHIRILSYVKSLNETYSTLFLYYYLSSIVTVCGGQLIMPPDIMENRVELTKSLIYIITFLFSIWVYFYLGDHLCHECAISGAIFYKNWSNRISYKDKYMTLMIIHRTQTSKVLSVGGFAPLDLQSFTQLVKFCMSFFAFINNVRG